MMIEIDRLRNPPCCWGLLALLVLNASPLAAQETSYRFEITPLAAFRVGGDFKELDGDGGVGLNNSEAAEILFNMKANPNGQHELLYAQQGADADTTRVWSTIRLWTS